MAAERKRPTIVRLLLGHHDRQGDELEVDDTGFDVGTAVHFAAHVGCLESLRLLLDHPGVDVNQKNGEGNTVLHLAVDANHIDVIHFLKTRPGLDLEATNHEGETPRMMAIAKNRKLAEKILVA